MTSNANVINLSSYRKAKTSPQPKQEPWHVNEACWVLQEARKMGDMGDPFFLNDWEIKFLTSMAAWPNDPTPKQSRCLKAIGDRMEAALEVLEQEQEQQEGPHPAA